MKRKNFAVLLCLMSVLFLLGACQKQSQTGGHKKVLNWVQSSELSTGDSTKAYDIFNYDVIGQFQEGLYVYDKDNKTVPAGCDGEPEVTDEGKHYRFHLRKDAKWSNGDPVTAKDYVFAWKRAVDPATAAQNAYVMYNIKNAKDINMKKAPLDSLGVKAVDDYTLDVQLEKATPYFKKNLIATIFFPLNEKFVKEKGDSYGMNADNLLSNGPFVIKGWDGTNSEWSYDKNDKYWDKDNVKLDQVKVQVIKDPSTSNNLFEGGKTDVAFLSGDLAKQYKDSPDFKAIPTASSVYLEYGTGYKKELQNEHLRRAMSLCVDRDVLINKVLMNGSTVPVNQLPVDYAKDPKTGKDFTEIVENHVIYDPEKAKEEWQKAKQELGKDTIEFEMLVTDDEMSKQVGEFVQSQIQTTLPDLKVNMKVMPTPPMFAKITSTKFDMGICGWAGSLGDPIEYYDIFTSDSARNHTLYKSSEYDELIRKAKDDYGNDEQARFETLVEAQNHLGRHAVTMPLYMRAYPVRLSPRVKGLETHRIGTRFVFRNIELEEKAK